MPEKTLLEALQYWTRTLGDAPAFIFRHSRHGRHVLTWNKLYTLSGRFAAILRERAVSRGHLVVNTLTNSPERVVSELAILMSGAASVNGQCLLADGSDLLRTLRVSRAAAILVDPDVPDSPWNVLKHHVTVGDDDTVTSESLPDLRKAFFIRRLEGKGKGDLFGHLETCTDWYLADDVTPDDAMMVFTTSGTTGFSKLLVYTHGTYMTYVESTDDTTKSFLPKQETVFNIAPLGWIGGFLGGTIVRGSTRVLCDVRAAGIPEDMPEFVWDSLVQEKCRVTYFSPKYLAQVAELANQRGDSQRAPSEAEFERSSDSAARAKHTLGTFVLAGFPVTRPLVKAALAVSSSVAIMYAATDFGMLSGMVVQDWTDYVDHDTGPPLTNVQVKIVSQQDEDIQLPVDQLGLILVKRPVFPRYLNDPEASAAILTSDGFIRTGDVGRLDQRGHLIVEGRGSDAIMRGHYIFYPAWLETRICACPGVRHVVIVGVPDPDVIEELCACVVLESDDVTLKEVREFVERDIVVKEDDPLSPRPRYYLRFESFPRTSTDKPNRKVIKKQAAHMLGLVEGS
ncbi:2-succinylbenzoate--CoA ligase-like [Littorina saxatilis]|uniref:Uncharacterized protein n=1 Tax=Littorina saxatilis TaxID=31220 RepID=A0AAN9BFS8_9CAEN